MVTSTDIPFPWADPTITIVCFIQPEAKSYDDGGQILTNTDVTDADQTRR